MSAENKVANGEEVPGVTWKGILGTLICNGDDCASSDFSVATTPVTLTGDWLFTPTEPDRYYTQSTGGDYVSEILCGIWVLVGSSYRYSN